MNHSKLACYTSLLILTACAPMGEQHPLAQVKTAEQFQLTHKVATPISSTWWHAYHDAQLNRLMDIAFAQSPDLDIAAARIRQAQAAYGLARSQQGVQAALNANGAALLHDSLNGEKPAIVDHLAGHEVSYGSLQLNAQWTWDLWGKHKAQTAAALGQIQAREYEQAATKLILAQSVAQTYWQWQTLQQQIHHLQQRITIKEKQIALLQQRIRAGLLPAAQLYPMQAALRQLQAAVRQTQGRADQTHHALATLIGQTPQQLPPLQAAWLKHTPSLPTNQLNANLLGNRPDIAAQREAIMVRNAQIQAARAEFYPNIRIKALAGLSEMKIGELPTSATLMAGLLPSVSLPIFTSGALQSNLAQKHAEFDEQVARYHQTVYQSLRQAADAITGYEAAAHAHQLQQESVRIAERNATAAMRRHRAGLENGLTALNAQDDVWATRAQAIETQAQQNNAWIQANSALGGGFSAE